MHENINQFDHLYMVEQCLPHYLLLHFTIILFFQKSFAHNLYLIDKTPIVDAYWLFYLKGYYMKNFKNNNQSFSLTTVSHMYINVPFCS